MVKKFSSKIKYYACPIAQKQANVYRTVEVSHFHTSNHEIFATSIVPGFLDKSSISVV